MEVGQGARQVVDRARAAGARSRRRRPSSPTATAAPGVASGRPRHGRRPPRRCAGGSHVVRVLERVEHEDEWRLVTLDGPRQDVVEAGHRRGSTTSAIPWWPSKPARAVSDRPRPRRSGCGDWSHGERASRAPRALRHHEQPMGGRRATNASSTGRRPATSSSPSESASGAGSEPTAAAKRSPSGGYPGPGGAVRGPLVEPRRPSVCGWGSRATASVRRSIGISRRPGRPVVAERHIRRPRMSIRWSRTRTRPRAGSIRPRRSLRPGTLATRSGRSVGAARSVLPRSRPVRRPGSRARSGLPVRRATRPAAGVVVSLTAPVRSLLAGPGSSRRPVPVGPGATWAIRTLATGSGPASSVAALVPTAATGPRSAALPGAASVRSAVPSAIAAAGASAAGPTSARRATTTSRPAAIGPPTPEVTTARSAAIRAGLAGLPVLGRTFSHRS